MQKAPGNTQRGNADPKRRKGRKQPKEYTQIPTRRRYQKQFKGENPENRKTVERGGDVKVN